MKICYKCKIVGYVVWDCFLNYGSGVFFVEIVDGVEYRNVDENKVEIVVVVVVKEVVGVEEDGEGGRRVVGEGLRCKVWVKVVEEEIVVIRVEENLVELSEE